MTRFEAIWSGLAASPLARMAGVLLVAFVLGTAIGLERQWRQRTAGLRTNVLVALGAAAFTELGGRLLGPDGATRIIAYVVSGIGFLGAGVILKDGTNIRGLNTAATLWCSAAVGAIAGSGFAAEAKVFASFVLGGNTVLRPLVNWINRRPLKAEETEAIYKVHAVCAPEAVPVVRRPRGRCEARTRPMRRRRSTRLLVVELSSGRRRAVTEPGTCSSDQVERC